MTAQTTAGTVVGCAHAYKLPLQTKQPIEKDYCYPLIKLPDCYSGCPHLQLWPPIHLNFGSCLCKVSAPQTLLLFTSRLSAPLHSPVSNRHSTPKYSALLSVPAQCHCTFDTFQWTRPPRNILASTQDISRICRTFRRYLSVCLIQTVTVSRRYLCVGTAHPAILRVQSAADSTCRSYQQSSLQWISLCPVHRNI